MPAHIRTSAAKLYQGRPPREWPSPATASATVPSRLAPGRVHAVGRLRSNTQCPSQHGATAATGIAASASGCHVTSAVTAAAAINIFASKWSARFAG